MSETRFESRTDYRLAIDQIIASANTQICIFDPDLLTPDFNDKARAESLAEFLSSGTVHNLRIVLHNTQHVIQRCPRIISLLKQFSHCFSIRETPDNLKKLADCFVLGDTTSVVVRFHTDYLRGKILMSEPEEVLGWATRFEELWAESLPAVPATQIGL